MHDRPTLGEVDLCFSEDGEWAGQMRLLSATYEEDPSLPISVSKIMENALSALIQESRTSHDCSKDEEAERKSPSLASKYSISDVSKPKTNFHMDYYVMTRGQGMLRQNSFCVLRAIQDYTLYFLLQCA